MVYIIWVKQEEKMWKFNKYSEREAEEGFRIVCEVEHTYKKFSCLKLDNVSYLKMHITPIMNNSLNRY